MEQAQLLKICSLFKKNYLQSITMILQESACFLNLPRSSTAGVLLVHSIKCFSSLLKRSIHVDSPLYCVWATPRRDFLFFCTEADDGQRRREPLPPPSSFHTPPPPPLLSVHFFQSFSSSPFLTVLPPVEVETSRQKHAPSLTLLSAKKRSEGEQEISRDLKGETKRK